MTRKLRKSPCAEVHYEDYSGCWVKIRNLYDYSYYKVNFHVRNGKEYKFFYTDYLQIATHSKGGQWYHTRVKRSDLHSTCVSASRGKYRVLTTEQVNAELELLRNSIPVMV